MITHTHTCNHTVPLIPRGFAVCELPTGHHGPHQAHQVGAPPLTWITPRRDTPAVWMLALFGVLALFAAAVAFMMANTSDQSHPNYGLTIFLAVVGAFLLLIAAIIHAGNRR